MTGCPDWRAWAAEEREGAPLGGEARARVVEHLTGCADCRRSAERVDPTLLFLGAAPMAVAADEVESIRHTVQALRRARGLEGRQASGGVHRAVAAGFLLALLLLLPGGNSGRVDRPAAEPAVAGAPFRTAVLTDAAPSGVSIVENLDRPGARVYQLSDNDLSLVMIVDESLDL